MATSVVSAAGPDDALPLAPPSWKERSKRRDDRVELRVDVVVEQPGQPKIVAFTENIGLGGAFIVTAETLNFGAHVALTLSLPGEVETIHVGAVVRWIRSGGIGVQFGAMGARDTYALVERLGQVEAGKRQGG